MLAKSENGCSWTEKQEPECLWFHGCLAVPWEGGVLLWKKSATLSESFRGGNNLKLFFEWNFLFCDRAAASVQR